MEAVFETDFCLKEYLGGVRDTEPITPSTRGVAYDFNAVGSDDGHGALSNNSYKVSD